MPSKYSDRENAERLHRYKWIDGTPLVNVTAISELIDDGKSGAMAYVAADLTRQGRDYRSEWDATSDLGSRVHKHLEKFLRGEDIDQADDEKGYVDALEKWILADNPRMIEQEAIVLSSVGFGGRFDLLAEIDGETALIDLKSSKKYAMSHSLQLSAYSHAEGIAVYGPTGALTGLRPLPPVDWCACLYVHENGTYDLDRYPADDHMFAIFCGLLDAYRAARTPLMKRLAADAKVYNRSVKDAREAKTKGNP